MMKRLTIIALTLLVSASFFTVSAAKKDKKKKKAEVETVAQPVILTTASDSVSYAAGMSLTNGLLPFLKERYGVDEAFMDDFLRGFEDAVKSGVDDPMKAYGAGISIAAMVKENMVPNVGEDLKGSADSLQVDLFNKGFAAALRKDTTHYTQEAAEKFFRTRAEKAKEAKSAALRKAGEDFLEQNKQRPEVKVTESGLQYEVLTQGTGEVPTAEQEVEVKYEGTLIDGTVFDSSYKRNPQSSKFRANQVIKGWTEALTMMPVGSKWKLYIPQQLAYGERQAGKIPAYSTLIFTVELIGITK